MVDGNKLPLDLKIVVLRRRPASDQHDGETEAAQAVDQFRGRCVRGVPLDLVLACRRILFRGLLAQNSLIFLDHRVAHRKFIDEKTRRPGKMGNLKPAQWPHRGLATGGDEEKRNEDEKVKSAWKMSAARASHSPTCTSRAD